MSSIAEEEEDDLRQTVSLGIKRQASFERPQPERPASKAMPTQKQQVAALKSQSTIQPASRKSGKQRRPSQMDSMQFQLS